MMYYKLRNRRNLFTNIRKNHKIKIMKPIKTTSSRLRLFCVYKRFKSVSLREHTFIINRYFFIVFNNSKYFINQ